MKIDYVCVDCCIECDFFNNKDSDVPWSGKCEKLNKLVFTHEIDKDCPLEDLEEDE